MKEIKMHRRQCLCRSVVETYNQENEPQYAEGVPNLIENEHGNELW